MPKVPDTWASMILNDWATGDTYTTLDHMQRVMFRNMSNATYVPPLRLSTPTSTGGFPLTTIAQWASTSRSTNVYHDHVARSAPPSNEMTIREGREFTVKLPDGSRLEVKPDGTIAMIDAEARITYRANRVRNFNPFLNASDKIEEFIRFTGTVGVQPDEVLRLPLELFIAWLIIQAARQDGEPDPDIPLLPKLRRRVAPHCSGCGRFLSRRHRVQRLEYCAPKCCETHYARALA